jgi:hypothetical protein
MKIDYQRQLSSTLSGKVMVIGVGLVCETFGVGLLVLLVWTTYKLFILGKTPDTLALIFLLVLLVIMTFCLTVGYRLLFNRPNNHGSLLSPKAWRLLGGIFAAIALVLLVFVIVSKAYSQLAAVAYSVLFCTWCFHAAKDTEAKNAKF